MLTCAAACGAGPESGAAGSAAAPPGPAGRIVSLDFCADQYVLELADPERILALSPDSRSNFSWHRERAAAFPSVRPTAEAVLALAPDTVVRSYGGGPGAAHFFRRAGFRTVQIGYAATLDGIRATLLAAARDLDAPDRGAAAVARFDARLTAVRNAPNPPNPARRPSALYVTPGGVTAGPDTLIHEMIEIAGLRNFADRPGFREIPLERLARTRPDVVAAAFYDTPDARYEGLWSAARHPLVRERLEQGPVVALSGAWVACGGWFAIRAVESLGAHVAGR